MEKSFKVAESSWILALTKLALESLVFKVFNDFLKDSKDLLVSGERLKYYEMSAASSS